MERETEKFEARRGTPKFSISTGLWGKGKVDTDKFIGLWMLRNKGIPSLGFKSSL
jgi:hypothetical protein